MPYTAPNFSTTAIISEGTKFSQYPPQIQLLMSDVAAYMTAQITAMTASLSSNAGYSVAQADQYYASLKNDVITGGGTITISATWSVLWSQRFVLLGNGYGSQYSTNGYFDITCPTTGTITGVGGAANKTATAAGIPLAANESLYYILPLGSANTSLAANFRVVGISAAVTIPNTWVKVCTYNGDGNYVEFFNGIALRNNTSINTNLYDVLASDVSGLSGVYAPLVSPTFTTPNIGVATGTSFNSITGLSSTSPSMNGTAAVGTGTTAARGDHVHPTDTSRAPIVSPNFTAGIAVGNVAQAGATTLDWYEEGTFTPTIIGATTAGAGTYSVQIGKFTRIGNRVDFSLHVTISAHTGTGNMQISGLPYASEATANNHAAVSIGYCSNLTFTNANVGGMIAPADTKIQLFSAASAGAVAAIAIDTAFEAIITGSYQV